MAVCRRYKTLFDGFRANRGVFFAKVRRNSIQPTLQISQMDIKIIFKGILLRRKDGIDIYFVVDMNFLRFARNRFFAADDKPIE